VPDVAGSPEAGYRMRARLHAHEGRLGFYREATHQLCDARQTAQLLPATHDWITHAENALSSMSHETRSAVVAVEIAENIAGDQRACHMELRAGAQPELYGALGEGLVGLSASHADSSDAHRIAGTPSITDTIRLESELPLHRDVRAFFQGNRFLVDRLVRYVLTQLASGPVVDLYAGVGLFGLSHAVSGGEVVTLVEGDAVSGADLQRNGQPLGDQVRVERQSVETYLSSATRNAERASFIVDPPRTGISKEAMAGILRARPRTIVYVSCDVATLARDARAFVDAGYDLRALTGMDLFPNTAHVESIATFTRS
jgi:23S rRNA (uracil1939-C5)-methyltransferase